MKNLKKKRKEKRKEKSVNKMEKQTNALLSYFISAAGITITEMTF